MEHNPYTVTWNIGNFGHLLQGIIQIEKFNIDIKSTGSSSHDIGIVGHVTVIHPYDKNALDKNDKNIKPYFADERLRFFPLYLNYIKNNFTKPAKEFAQTYWNYTEPKCPISFNIDMTNFLIDTDKFIDDIKSFLQKETISTKTLDFIDTKKQSNLPLYHKYIEVTNNILPNNVRNLTPLELGITMCHYAKGDYTKILECFKKYV